MSISAPDLLLEGLHWRFALAVYGRAGVPAACLKLQDQAGVDVNMLLVALFVAQQRGAGLSCDEIAAADAAVADWHREIVVGLRAIRRRLKVGPAPAPGGVAEKLRDRIKSGELMAEQIEQAVLADWFEQNPPQGGADPKACAFTARRVVEFYRGAPVDGTELANPAALVARAAASE